MSEVLIHIPPELFMPAETAHFEGTWDVPVLKYGPDLYTFEAPVTWQVDVTNTGEALLLNGTCEGDARTVCARCGEGAEVPLFGEIEGYFFMDGESALPEDLEDDEFDVLPDNHDIDIEPLMTAAFALDVPQIPLCDDDCKGLCPQCGANLNEGPCDCAPEEDVIDDQNPFAALKGFVPEA